jgi:hypothetical protein
MRIVSVQSAGHPSTEGRIAGFFGKTASPGRAPSLTPDMPGQTMKISGHQWHLLSQRGAM